MAKPHPAALALQDCDLVAQAGTHAQHPLQVRVLRLRNLLRRVLESSKLILHTPIRLCTETHRAQQPATQTEARMRMLLISSRIGWLQPIQGIHGSRRQH